MSFYTSLSGLRGAQTDLSDDLEQHRQRRLDRLQAQPRPVRRHHAGVEHDRRARARASRASSSSSRRAASRPRPRDLDLAISGTGFFVTRDALTGGTTYFSRNGSLSVDGQRYLVDSNGGYVQVLPVDAEGNVTASGLAASRNIQLPLTSGTPRATSLVTLAVNLPRTADKPEDRAVYSAAQSLCVRPARSEQLQLFAAADRLRQRGQRPVGDALFRAHRLDRRRRHHRHLGRPHVHRQRGSLGRDRRDDCRPTPLHLSFDATGAMTSPTGAIAFASVFPSGASAPLAVTLDFGTATKQARGRASASARSTRTASPRRSSPTSRSARTASSPPASPTAPPRRWASC